MTTETKFTPGPWTVGDNSWRVGGDRYWNIQAPTTFVSMVMEGSARAEADAYLIAAAPDLYGALEAMADDYEEYGYNPDSGKWDVPLFNGPVHERARAALARARGEET